MPETEIQMVQYPTGRIRSLFGTYDWNSVDLYTVFEDLRTGLEEVEEDTSLYPEFTYLGDGMKEVESLKELLEQGTNSPLSGSVSLEAGEVEGEIQYTPGVPHETDASLQAEFTVPEVYEQQLREILGSAGFKDPVIPRINRKAIEG